MGLIGSALGRGLAGAGGAAASLANKYIDEELAASRAKMLADLQHDNMVRADQYQIGEPRQGQLRANATAATMAQGQATRASELEGLNDTDYQGAVTAKKDADYSADTTRGVDRINATAPAEASRAGLISRATERERSAGANDLILRKVAQMEQVLGRKMTEEERMAAIGLAKGGPSGVEVETVMDDGKGNKTTRKWREGMPKPPTEEVALADAEAAVANGASREAVNAELVRMGFPKLEAKAASARPRLNTQPKDPLRGVNSSALESMIRMRDPRSAAAKAELDRRARERMDASQLPVPGGA